MSVPEKTWIVDAVSRWLRSPSQTIVCPSGLSPERLGALLEANRLLPLFQTMPLAVPDGDDWDRFRDRLDMAYQRGLLQGLQQLKSGRDLMDCLAASGIKSLAVRGPFLAEDVYGDPAVRLSSDIDILVSYRDRRRAWAACERVGYRSLDRECPLWPVDKHRIHWRIQREGDPVVCELHWAVEPVYGAMTFDYEALLKDRTPTQRLLLLCLHAGEHILEQFGLTPPAEPGRHQQVRPGARISSDQALDQGMLFRWLDVALFIRKYGSEVDWSCIDRQARDRRISACMALCLRGVKEWLGLNLPPEADRYMVVWALSAERQRSSGLRCWIEGWWERRGGRAVGLETPLQDVLYYLWPHALFFAPSHGVPLMLKRVVHSLAAVAVLSREFLSYACFAIINWGRRRLPVRDSASTGTAFVKSCIVMAVASLSLVASAHEFSDDYGDTPAAAQPLIVGSNRTGHIEIDMDQDWFYFQAAHSTNEVVVNVTTGTLWSSTAGLAAPDGKTMLVSTDSVASVTSRVTWIHFGPPATYFVRVAGFASFTTGTYTIAVSERPFEDQDQDGMPDAWEIARFGSTNQPASGTNGDYDVDGVFNIDEFLGGTLPNDDTSRFRVTGFSGTNGPHSVSWAAAPFRTYEVEASTNLSGGGWDYLGTVTNLDALETLELEDATAPMPPVRFYRVRCLY